MERPLCCVPPGALWPSSGQKGQMAHCRSVYNSPNQGYESLRLKYFFSNTLVHDQEFLFFYLVNDAKGENLRHILTGRDNEIRTRVAAWDLFFSHQKAQNGVSLRYNAVKWFAGSANFSKNKRNMNCDWGPSLTKPQAFYAGQLFVE